MRIGEMRDFIVLNHNIDNDVEELNPGWIGTNFSISNMIYYYVTAVYSKYNKVDEKEFARQFMREYDHIPNLNLVALIDYAVKLKKEKELNDKTLQRWYEVETKTKETCEPETEIYLSA